MEVSDAVVSNLIFGRGGCGLTKLLQLEHKGITIAKYTNPMILDSSWPGVLTINEGAPGDLWQFCFICATIFLRGFPVEPPPVERTKWGHYLGGEPPYA